MTTELTTTGTNGTALTPAETETLAEHEATIENELLRFYEKVGNALTIIRDRKLYRGAYPTFEAYCRSRWGYGRTYVHYLCNATRIHKQLAVHSCEHLPRTEAHCRPLAKLPVKDCPLVWNAIVTGAPKDGEGKPAITVKLVKAGVDAALGLDVNRERERKERDKIDAELVQQKAKRSGRLSADLEDAETADDVVEIASDALFFVAKKLQEFTHWQDVDKKRSERFENQLQKLLKIVHDLDVPPLPDSLKPPTLRGIVEMAPEPELIEG